MTIKTSHSIEMLIEHNSTVEELLDALSSYQAPESAHISVRHEVADRPYTSDNYYIKVSW